MKAMVFAAGLGTRLRPLTDHKPKALVNVAGQPMLGHILAKLRGAGFSSVTVNVHHFAEQVKAYLDGNDFGLGVSVSDESERLLDTGGGIRHAEPLLNGEGPFLVHNVDIFSNLDIRKFVGAARPEALATLVVSDRETSRYLLFDDEMRLVGWTNVRTGELRSTYPGLNVSECRRLAFAGIHLISEDIFRVFREREVPEFFSIIDFYLSVCKDYPIYGYVPEGFRLVDAGKPETLPLAAALAANDGGCVRLWSKPHLRHSEERSDEESISLKDSSLRSE